ncbi:MAG: glycine betaine ABC transporter substrate-binding protein [Caldilineaceae bacterium]
MLSRSITIFPLCIADNSRGAFSLIQRLDTAFNIAWIRKASFDSAYGLAVSAQLAGEGFRTLFDLAEAVRVSQRSLTICADEEFANDEELGLPSVATIYDIELNPATITILPSEEIYQALRAGTCDVGAVQRTDGRIAAWDLYVLEDSLGAFPNYSPAPVIRRDLLTRYPELESYLDQLGPTLSSAAITALNAQVDLGADGEAATGDEASVEAVASTFLCENALIQTCGDAIDRTTSATTVVTESTSLTPVLAMIPLTISPTLAVSSTAENGVINDDAADAADTPAVAEQASFSVTVTTPNTFGVNVRTTANAGAEVVTVVRVTQLCR